MNLRKANISDIASISQVIQKAYSTVAQRYGLTLENCPKHPSNCSAQWIDSDFAKGVKYFVIESGQELIGCVALEKATDEICYLERLAVVPERRNQGVGRTLVNHVQNQAKSMGFTKIGIGIIAEQQELKEWYKKIGFIETGRKSFRHLPFEVAFLEYHIKNK